MRLSISQHRFDSGMEYHLTFIEVTNKMTDNANTDILKNKAMLIRIDRKKMSRNKMDKNLSADLVERMGATEANALRVNKSIFTKDSTSGFMDVYLEGSKYYYSSTLPWDDTGWRLLPVDIYEEFVKKFKKFTADYRKEVVGFIENISSHLESAKAVLNKGFDKNDYKFISPNGALDNDMLLEQFNLQVCGTVITTGSDIRCDLNEADKEVLAEQINAAAASKFAKAQESIIIQIVDVVGKMHERLSNVDATYRDTLITNLEELCDLVPRLNIAGDPAINKLAADAKVRLLQHDPQTLRDNPDLRKEVSDAADDILHQARGLL